MKKLLLFVSLLFCFLQIQAQLTPESVDLLNNPNIQADTTNYPSPAYLAQAQLDAYNAHDIDAFVSVYADSVEVYEFPNKLILKGKDNMYQSYKSFFDVTPDLHCELVTRVVQGNTVIDKEHVTGLNDGSEIKTVAIYKIVAGKIEKVYFLE